MERCQARGRALETVLAIFAFVTVAALASAQGVRPRGSLFVHLNVHSSLLLSATDANGVTLSQGGEQYAAVPLTFLPGQPAEFYTSVLVANNPQSPGYKLVAVVVGSASGAQVDGVALTPGQEVTIGDSLPYRESSKHTLTLAPEITSAISVLLIARPE